MLRQLGLGLGFWALACGRTAGELDAFDSTAAGAPGQGGAPGAAGQLVTSGGASGFAQGGSSSAGVSGASTVGAGGADTAGAGGADTAGAGGALFDCTPTSKLTLSDLSFSDADGDGKYELGEQVTVSVTLSNPSSEPHDFYPGVWFSVTPASIVPDSSIAGGDFLYALEAHGEHRMSAVFYITHATNPGALANVIATAADTGGCRGRTLSGSFRVAE